MATRQATAARDGATFSDYFADVIANMERVIQGKDEVIELVLLCLVAEGHLLIEDVPGVGKTSLAKALAASIDGSFGRIQFTPDLLPVRRRRRQRLRTAAAAEFEFRPGPVFANIVLADEINRASPKTQSALLEAMAERQVTVDGTTYQLAAAVHGHRHAEPDRARGHLSAAREPARPLPDAHVDRLPGRDGRARRSSTPTATTTRSTTSRPVVTAARGRRPWPTRPAPCTSPPACKGYLVDLADATRRHPALALGMSPRATLGLQRGRPGPRPPPRAAATCTPDDIKALAEPVLAHRLLVTPEAQLQGRHRRRRPERRAAVPSPSRPARRRQPDPPC